MVGLRALGPGEHDEIDTLGSDSIGFNGLVMLIEQHDSVGLDRLVILIDAHVYVGLDGLGRGIGPNCSNGESSGLDCPADSDRRASPRPELGVEGGSEGASGGVEPGSWRPWRCFAVLKVL